MKGVIMEAIVDRLKILESQGNKRAAEELKRLPRIPTMDISCPSQTLTPSILEPAPSNAVVPATTVAPSPAGL